jgi:aminotransferase
MAYDERRRIIVNGLREAGLPTFEPQGAFYAFPDIRPSGLTSEQFATQLLEEERVAVVPGGAFGPSGEGFVRCSYATSTEEVKEAVERIKRFTSKRL